MDSRKRSQIVALTVIGLPVGAIALAEAFPAQEMRRNLYRTTPPASATIVRSNAPRTASALVGRVRPAAGAAPTITQTAAPRRPAAPRDRAALVKPSVPKPACVAGSAALAEQSTAPAKSGHAAQYPAPPS